MTTRIVSGGSAVALALLLLTGCGSNAPAPTTAGPNIPQVPPGARAPSGSTTDIHPEAVAAAREFLTAVEKGTPDLAKVTPEFKQLIGPPTTEADKARGYSDWAAEQWLKENLVGKAKTDTMTAASVTPETVAVTASARASEKPACTILRLVKSGSGFLVDWVHFVPQKYLGTFAGTGDKPAIAFAAHAFLDTLITGQHGLTEALLSPAAKARLAPPLNDPLGYNRAMLGIKLAGLRGKATEWKARVTEASVTGQLLEPGAKERAFTLKLVKGPRPTEWLVEEFDVK